MSKTRWLIVIPLGVVIAILVIVFAIISHEEEMPTGFVDCLNHKYSEVSSNDEELKCEFKVLKRKSEELFNLCEGESGGILGEGQNAYCTITYYEKSPTCYSVFCD